ncbi:MAG: hypothetical protein QOE58_2812 [Actinomycetota bacterium]|jgi:hypothetical protein|nr:hypothetical protein [Actinomycetota bacterium]
MFEVACTESEALCVTWHAGAALTVSTKHGVDRQTLSRESAPTDRQTTKPYRKSSPYGVFGTALVERFVERFQGDLLNRSRSFAGRSTSKDEVP